MIQRIMVPLDGSRLAESALAPASHLASVSGAAVTLLHVLEANPPAAIHGDRHLATQAEAESYLADVACRAFPPAVKVTCHVHAMATDDVVRGLAEHGEELSPDLVVMCTHGRGGIKTLLHGNIAQQLVARGDVPILLVHPEEPHTVAFACRHILAPFDGVAEHGCGVDAAAEVAGFCGAQVHLVFAVPTVETLGALQSASSRLMPGASQTLLDIATDGARLCLADCMQRIQARGVSVTAEVRRGRPEDVIVQVAEARQADLIVLATHGKAGSRAFWAESVAQRILHRTNKPLLLVPIVAKKS
jgi:nucleotide-binding universal stress UspA family protein